MPSTRRERLVEPQEHIMFVPNNKNIKNIHANTDTSNKESMQILINQIDDYVKQQEELILVEATTGKQAQQEAHYNGMVLIKNNIKNMSVGDFNATYNCSLIQLLMDKMMNNSNTTTTTTTEALFVKKRNFLDIETPAPGRNRKAMRTPATVLRTARKGEQIYSKNGSPIDKADEGALIATVTKKRNNNSNSIQRGSREGESDENVNVDMEINVGCGRTINLADPTTMKHLDSDMKDNAISQLKALQDQMATLMAHLSN